MFRLKIGILDDYQNVALSLADWSSLDAYVEVFTGPFSGRGRRHQAAGGLRRFGCDARADTLSR